MRHFDLGEWADFARDLVKQEQQVAMQNHLHSGCKECGKVLSMWRRVQEIGQRSAHYEPPAVVVKSIKGIYVIYGARAPEPKKTTIAQLLFDSFHSPCVEGIRSAGPSLRQLLYGTDGYRIDLQIESQENSEKMALVGQVLNSRDPGNTVSAAPVTIVKGQKVRALGVTNRFGEFHVECEVERGLQLRVRLPQEIVSLPVFELSARKADGTEVLIDSPGVKTLRGWKNSPRGRTSA
jgi:hypothetical protein